jgi:hypothetical protein
MKLFVASVLLTLAGAPALAQPTIILPPAAALQPTPLASRCIASPGGAGSDVECTIAQEGAAAPAMRILIRTQTAATPCRASGAREVAMTVASERSALRGALPTVIQEPRERRCAA